MNKIKKNIGCMERNIRILIGVAILGVGYYYKSYWGLVGIIPLLTAIISWCPLKTIFRCESFCSPNNKGSKCCFKSKKK